MTQPWGPPGPVSDTATNDDGPLPVCPGPAQPDPEDNPQLRGSGLPNLINTFYPTPPNPPKVQDQPETSNRNHKSETLSTI